VAEDACDQCVYSKCCSQLQACAQDAGCKAMPRMGPVWQAFVTCFDSSCGQACSSGGAAGGSGGGGAGGSGAGGSGGAPGSGAVIKLCHSLARTDGSPVVLEANVGSVKLTASSGMCSTPKGQPCVSIPAGSTTITYTIGGQPAPGMAPRTIDVKAGDQLILAVSFDQAMGRPVYAIRVPTPPNTCADF
jgi:hypothetical protein